jgi:hypothetical protein
MRLTRLRGVTGNSWFIALVSWVDAETMAEKWFADESHLPESHQSSLMAR